MPVLPQQKKPVNIRLLTYALLVLLLPVYTPRIPAGMYYLLPSDLLLIVLALGLLIKKQFRFTPLTKLVALWVVCCLCSGLNAVRTDLFTISLLPLGYALLATTIHHQCIREIRLWMRPLLAGALLLASLPAFVEVISGETWTLFHYNNTPEGRYQGFTLNPNQLASFILLTFWSLCLSDLDRHQRLNSKHLGLLLLLCIPLAMSASRSTLIAVTITFIWLATTMKGLKLPYKLLSLLALPAIMLLLYALDMPQKVFLLRMFEFSRDLYANFSTQWNIEAQERLWAEGWQQFLAHPVLGVGLGNFICYNPRSAEVHNAFISTLSETGLIGFAGLCAILIFLFRDLRTKFLQNKPFAIAGFCFLLLFLGMNLTGNLIRERWVWLFIPMLASSNFTADARSGVQA